MVELEQKISKVKEKLAQKIRERGEAAGEPGSWHDNVSFDLLNEEVLVLEAQLHDLQQQLNMKLRGQAS